MCCVGSSRFDIGGRGFYPYMVVLIFCVVVAVSYLLYALRVYTVAHGLEELFSTVLERFFQPIHALHV